MNKQIAISDERWHPRAGEGEIKAAKQIPGFYQGDTLHPQSH